MTVTDETVDVNTTVESQEPQKETRGRRKERDFTKYRLRDEELANYVNEHSGLDPVTPNQIKAILALRLDWGNTPGQKELRDQRKIKREIDKSKYEGMSPEQITASKAADRAARQAAKLEEKAREAMEKAQHLAAAAAGSGEDLAAFVESQQSGGDDESTRRRGLGRRNR